MNELSWKELALRLKELRKKNKLTIERLANIVGVSTSFISMLEKGESGISIENLYKMAQVFNCSLDYLVTGETDRNHDYSKFSSLNTLLYDYSEKEIEFIIDTAKFLRDRVVVE